MTDRVQILAIAGSLTLLVVVLELVRRRRLAEQFSVLWIVSALILLAVAWRRDLLDRAAQWLDVHYPPAVLLLCLVLIVFVASLTFTAILSAHQRRIDRLLDEVAVLSAEVRELRDGLPAEPKRPFV